MTRIDLPRNVADLHVLHVITGLGTGGAETSLLRVVEASRDSGMQHSVVSLIEEGPIAAPLRAAGATVHSLAMARGSRDPRAMARLIRLVSDARPDVLQGWMYHANLAASLAGLLTRVPVLWAIRHALDAYEHESAALRAVIRCSAAVSRAPTAILYNSQRSATQHAAVRFSARRAAVIPNGFAVERFRADPRAALDVRAELGIRPDAPVIGLIARVDPLKDHRTFIRAAELLHARQPDVHFLLAGLGTDAASGTIADALVGSPIAPLVHRLGARTDVSALMNACTVVTLTSISEGFPNVIGEAMACERMCVATDVGDAATLVGDCGIIVPPGDAQAIARAWESQITRSATDRERCGVAARARINAMYTIDSVFRRYAHTWAAAADANRRAGILVEAA